MVQRKMLVIRGSVPLMILMSLTALYALAMRTTSFGLTVDRFWAFVVAAAVESVSFLRKKH